MLRSPTDEYEIFYYEAFQQLWHYVNDFDDKEIIASALNSLRNYDYTALQLKHMPKVYQENLRIPNEYQKVIEASKNSDKPLTADDVVPYIPGECWIQFLDKINQNAIENAIELVSHLIEMEISQFRSGVYMLPEGRAEPNNLSQLHPQSQLRAIIKFCTQSTHQHSSYSNTSLLTLHCLRCISKKFTKPIPPVNCFFLIKFINVDTTEDEERIGLAFELKKTSLTIAANQIEHSGSARDLIENYLQNFKASDKSDDEILVVMDLLQQICNGATPRILADFLKNTFSFAFERSKSSYFEKGCLFMRLIRRVALVCENNCKIPENYDICVDEIVKYNNIINFNQKVSISSLENS